MGPAIIIIAVTAVLLLLPLFILAPYKAGKKKTAPFYGQNFAHRGLYEKDQSIPENSLAAFMRAADNGYGMELDVQLSRDGRVVVFHDDTLGRMCGVDSRVDELDYDQLIELKLKDTEERIPLFSEALERVDGRTPIIVELKNGRKNKELCQKTLAMLREYKGVTCVESFNPMIVAWFRFHAPDILRGQLAQQPEKYRRSGMSALQSGALGSTALNFAARPNFIAYCIGKKPFAVRFAEWLGAMKVAWTSHSTDTEKDFDAVIFEHYTPDIRYK